MKDSHNRRQARPLTFILYKTRSRMLTDTLKDDQIIITKLSHNSEYYNSVFKKTERTVSTLFYILSYVEDTPRSGIHVKSLTDRANVAYETALASLTWPVPGAAVRLESLQTALLGLLGTVKIASAARVLPSDLASVLEAELDLVMRYLRNHYFEVEQRLVPMSGGATPRPKVARPSRTRERLSIPAGDISSDARLVYSALTGRADRIKTVLDAKPDATIKDIAEIITDVSEKTIQRELNSLIEKGQVIRQGERRWSRYTLTK